MSYLWTTVSPTQVAQTWNVARDLSIRTISVFTLLLRRKRNTHINIVVASLYIYRFVGLLKIVSSNRYIPRSDLSRFIKSLSASQKEKPSPLVVANRSSKITRPKRVGDKEELSATAFAPTTSDER